jgi:hypothetical protein
MSATSGGPIQILLASPREPSGGSWLINCLLELGIRVNMKTIVDRVWRSANSARSPAATWESADNGEWRLHPRADSLRKWLPVLSRRETLKFRDDVTVFYVQDLPRPEFQGARTVLFVRDPRDAIQSYYRRIRPGLSLQEFVRFPHPETLLDAITHWRLFVDGWLAREGIHLYRFEDYKLDDVALLTRIVKDLGLEASTADIERAAFESSYEKARAAEERYRAAHPGDDEIAMRAGRVGEWKDSSELVDLSREIETHAGSLLTRLGYPCRLPAAHSRATYAISQLRFLPAFEGIELPSAWREAASTADPMDCPFLSETLARAAKIDAHTISGARLHAREARQLLDSLCEYARAWQQHQQNRTDAIRAEFENGSNYQMMRIRELANRLKAKRARSNENPSSAPLVEQTEKR